MNTSTSLQSISPIFSYVVPVRRAFAIMLGLLLSAGIAASETRTWTGSGFYTTGSNWEDSEGNTGAPQSGDDVIFGDDGDSNTRLSEDRSIQGVTFNRTIGNFNFRPAGAGAPKVEYIAASLLVEAGSQTMSISNFRDTAVDMDFYITDTLTVNAGFALGNPSGNLGDDPSSGLRHFQVQGSTTINTDGVVTLSRLFSTQGELGGEARLGDLTMNGGTLNLTGGSGGTGSATGTENLLHVDRLEGGGVIRADKANTSGALVVDGAGSGTFTGTIENHATDASVRLVHSGTGSLELTGDNTFSGGTTLNGGTLIAGHNNALGTGQVQISGTDAALLRVGQTTTLSNNIAFSNSNAVSRVEVELAASDSFSTGTTGWFRSDFAGGRTTTVSFLDGAASGPATMELSFATTSSALNDHWRMSDIFNLSGIDGEIFALQMEVAEILGESFVGWFDGMEWVNAVEGNDGGPGALAEQGFVGSFGSFTDIGGSASADYLGSWGYDTSAGTVWAVLNHNSSFAVIPEPSTVLLILMVFGGWLGLHRRCS